MRQDEVYAAENRRYDRLVSHEDHAGNLLPALLELLPSERRTLVELGCGTGRVTFQLAPSFEEIIAFDASEHMLELAREKALQAGHEHIAFERAEHHALPLESDRADVAVEGWAFGGLTLDADRARGQEAARVALTEMARVVRPGGRMVLIETLGTNSEEPRVTHPGLRWLYERLASEGFAHRWIRTDYAFADEAEARAVLSFFFGADLHIQPHGDGVLVPECTGLWWRDV